MTVFPAYAGVILKFDSGPEEEAGVPRIRGGDPASGNYSMALGQCSPHTRG